MSRKKYTSKKEKPIADAVKLLIFISAQISILMSLIVVIVLCLINKEYLGLLSLLYFPYGIFSIYFAGCCTVESIKEYCNNLNVTNGNQ